jgi:hypothetical protein
VFCAEREGGRRCQTARYIISCVNDIFLSEVNDNFLCKQEQCSRCVCIVAGDANLDRDQGGSGCSERGESGGGGVTPGREEDVKTGGNGCVAGVSVCLSISVCVRVCACVCVRACLCACVEGMCVSTTS